MIFKKDRKDVEVNFDYYKNINNLFYITWNKLSFLEVSHSKQKWKALKLKFVFFTLINFCKLLYII